jgi:hypothetical protein
MPTEQERIVRAATRNLEPEHWQLKFSSEKATRSYHAIWFILALWAIIAIALIALLWGNRS